MRSKVINNRYSVLITLYCTIYILVCILYKHYITEGRIFIRLYLLLQSNNYNNDKNNELLDSLSSSKYENLKSVKCT